MTKEQFIKAVQPKMYEAAMLALSGNYTPEEHAGYVKRLQDMRKAKAAASRDEQSKQRCRPCSLLEDRDVREDKTIYDIATHCDYHFLHGKIASYLMAQVGGRALRRLPG